MSRPDGSVATPRIARWKSRLKLVLASTFVIACCVTIRQFASSEEAAAQAPAGRQPSASARPVAQANPVNAPAAASQPPKKLEIVAIVNGEEIHRQDLANDCLRIYGEEMLEKLVNKRLITSHCQQRGITVTDKEIAAEIDRMARKFQLPTEQWIQMLKQERGIDYAQYAEDIIWPTVALRKLAADQLTVSAEELNQAYQTEYGEAVRARIIVLGDAATARQVHAKVKATAADFSALAVSHSTDANSASAGGLVQPIRRFAGDTKIEEAAFAMQPGQISGIIPVGNQFVILKCEGRIPPRDGITQEAVKERLTDAIKDRKLRSAAADVFQKLQEKTKIENVYNDRVKSQQMPGVAAVVNGQKVTVVELAEMCVDRHGQEILDGTIHRRLLEQDLKRQKLTLTQQDLDDEVAQAAIAMGKTLPSGAADVKTWLKLVTEQQGITVDQYMRDAVWPSAALKKLVGNVEITDADLQRGFEANYGPRARCRAIVLGSHRKAQEVWELARANPTVEYFAKLAEQYSMEASSKALGGQVPPIQRHGGQPVIEAEAFKLTAGQLSSIIQVTDKYVILLSEGFTEPTKVALPEVKDLIIQDLQEKKVRIAMAQKFSDLKDNAQIDNFLAGTTQSPKTANQVGQKQPAAAVRPSAAVRQQSPVRQAGHAAPAVKAVR